MRGYGVGSTSAGATNGESGVDDQQQELFVLVDAWVVALPHGGARLRGESALPDDPSARAELLLLSPSFLVPALTHNGITVWDTLAIAEYLQEVKPKAGLFPRDLAARTWCRAVSGEMHSGFSNLRSALPMNIRARHPGFKVWAGAQADIDRIVSIWRECLSSSGGPFLFGDFSVADAMYAPVCSRFLTYSVPVDAICAAYRDRCSRSPP